MTRITSRMLGENKITVLNDGGTEFDFDLFPDTDEKVLLNILGNPDATGLSTRFNVCLIETPRTKILVDAGVGNAFGPVAGFLPEALKETGITPNEIDKLVISHLHPDHICGSWDGEGLPIFQNAEVVIAETEYNFWTNENNFLSGEEPLASWLPIAQNFLRIYGDRISTASPSGDIASGISFHALPGHTPGHCGILVESKGEQFLYSADLIVIEHIQLHIPEGRFAFDVNKEEAAKTRVTCLDMLAKDQILFSGGHIHGPKICNVVSSYAGYQLV